MLWSLKNTKTIMKGFLSLLGFPSAQHFKVCPKDNHTKGPGAGWSSVRKLSKFPKKPQMFGGRCYIMSSGPLCGDTNSNHHSFTGEVDSYSFCYSTPPPPKAQTRERYKYNVKYSYRQNIWVLIVSDSQPCHVILTKCEPGE